MEKNLARGLERVDEQENENFAEQSNQLETEELVLIDLINQPGPGSY